MIHDRSNAMGAKQCHACPHTVRDHAVEDNRIYCVHPACACDRSLPSGLVTVAKVVGRTLRALGFGKGD